MANMEFLYANFANTTSNFSITSGTNTVAYLIDRETYPQYSTSGKNDDTLVASIIINFTSAKYVDRVILRNINWKSFHAWYNATANSFALSGAETTASDWITNSATNMYLKCSLTSITKIGFDITSTMLPNEEKKCGDIVATQVYTTLDRNPTADGYKPKYDRKEHVHAMTDGGTVTYFIADRFKGKIKLNYVSQDQIDSLKNLYDEYTEFNFVPRPTGTAWNNEIWEVNWIGDFDFLQFSDNFIGNGYDGSIDLQETPK